MTQAKAAKKAIPVTERMTKQGPTQTLQECVGGSQNNRGMQRTDIQSNGVPRI
jgi:hypothetical protein